MVIKVNDKYRIESDPHCWMVQRFKGIRKDTGKEDWKPLTYHTSFGNALESLSEYRIRVISDQATVDEVRATLRQIRDEALAALSLFRELKPQ